MHALHYEVLNMFDLSMKARVVVQSRFTMQPLRLPYSCRHTPSQRNSHNRLSSRA